MFADYYWPAIVFFSVLFAVFYAVAYSVLLGIRENYLRHYQKSDLQWTGPESRFPRRRPRLTLLGLAAVLTAWVVVHFVIAS